MILDTLTKEQCEIVRQWRNQIPETLRTPYPLTREMQEDFYKDVICNRNAPHRYWAIVIENRKCNQITCKEWIDSITFVGMGGIVNIQWENRIGEISLIIDPEQRDKGYGYKSAELLLDQAFNHLNLQTVFGECYLCNQVWEFWGDITDKYKGYATELPNKKFWKGEFHNSLYFSIDRENFNGKISS